MNPYRVLIYGLRLLLSVVVLLTVIAVVMPFVEYQTKNGADTAVMLYDSSDSKGNGRLWTLDYEKVKNVSSEKPDILIVTSGVNFESLMNAQIDHNILVFEMLFNQMAKGSRDSELLSRISDVAFSGFTGKTVSELGRMDLLPNEWISTYEQLYSRKWAFSGEGVVFFREDAVIVLKQGTDYNGSLTLSDGAISLPYGGYFEVTTSRTQPLAVLDLDVTAQGAQILESYGIGHQFPALSQSVNPLFTAYYYTLNVGSQTIDVPHNYAYMPFLMSNKGIFNQASDEEVFWKWYFPKLSNLLSSRHLYEWEPDKLSMSNAFGVEGTQIMRTDKTGVKKPYFIKGINLGAALPGKTFTEFPQEKMIYKQWLLQMKTMNINTVRVYTLLPPEFYEALYEINQNQEEPIYLLQEIWPEEHPIDSNYLDETYNETYRQEIQWAVSALHGDVTIPQRAYRAYGIYQRDVSAYVLGYLVGREMEPQEVKQTDLLNAGYHFEGEYFYSEVKATPTEAWLASACDFVLQIENAKYGDAPLVAIVSWPTLDPLIHDSEWNSSGDKSLQYNDSLVVDIGHIGVDKRKVSGFFGAYHIYPNYPDFMNLDPEYASYSDAEGQFRYGGYLKVFMAQHTRYPAVVAEYGISTSMYTAHYNPDGFNHGGLSERQQGEGIVRMTKAIVKEGYAGAIVFEWMDEWTKKTWITEPFMIPYNRHSLWHNVLDPEQAYGLLANKPSEPAYTDVKADLTAVKNLKRVQFGQNEAYIFLDFEFKQFTDINKPFQLVLSTDSEIKGDDFWEFLITVDKKSDLLANPGYNWTKGHFSAVAAPFELYERLVELTNIENMTKTGIYTPSISQDLSHLNRGTFEIAQNHIQVKDNHLTIRIPYGLIGVSDPSSQLVLSDERVGVPSSQDSIGTKISPIMRFKLSMNGEVVTFEQKLGSWEIPIYTPTLKGGTGLIADYFQSIP